jgi:deoxyribodipyrimidine photo-lyase
VVKTPLVPPLRITRLNERSERSERDFVLYWIQIAHRAEQNFALTAAIEAANRLRLPLVVYHGLGCTYPHANDRITRFILEGVAELPQRFARRGIRYHFYLRQTDRDPNNLVYLLAKRAALVVTDDFPAFIIPGQSRNVASRVDVATWAVDTNGMVPLAAIPGEQYGAYTIRPKLRRLFPEHWKPVPEPKLLRDSLAVRLDIPETSVTAEGIDGLLARSDIDHTVIPSRIYRGGYRQARARLERFVASPLASYATARNEPGQERTSRLSAYLHFGQIAVQEIAAAVSAAQGAPQADRDAYLEELIVRRELAFNFCRYNPHHQTLEALPAWAKATLAKHASDPRPWQYAPEAFEAAQTHDELWNAIQAELLVTGTMFGYYRMYWGKKIIEWSANPAEAQATMIRLHDTYALDGRDPNTYASILWCFGKHDRPWSERPVLGTVRCMSRAGMESKTRVADYLARVNAWCREADRPDLLIEVPEKRPRARRG